MSRAAELAEQHKGRADDCGQLARAVLADRERQAGEAVAWFRVENGMRVYYETKAWDDLTPLFASLPAPQAVQAGLGPLSERTVLDAIRSAYDLGYNDARNARALPGDGAPGYKGRDVEADHGGALISRLRVLAAAPSPDGKAEQAEAPSQCDGCAIGAPINGWGNHEYPDGSLMGCTKNRYATQPTASNAGEREIRSNRDAYNAGYEDALQTVGVSVLVGHHHTPAALASKPPAGDAMRDALESIRAHCKVQPSALAKAIVATCDSALTTAPQPEQVAQENLIGEIGDWVRNNYQDYPTVAGLCSALECTFHHRAARARGEGKS